MPDDPSGIFLAKPADVGDGKRLAVKDLFDTPGVTTTYGSIVYAEHVPETSADAVARLEAAGYVNAGKTNLHEFAYGITSVNPHYGTVPNPRFPGHMAGGSSGGSAAARAAGLAVVGLGSASGGSIRIPAACCGLVGFKPTFGLVPMAGCFPLAPSFDHAGPIAGSVADCGAAMAALAPGLEPGEADLADLRVGVAWVEDAEPLVRARVSDVAEWLRARPVELPLPEVGPVFMREVARVHRDLFAEHAAEYGENVRTKIERCLALPDDAYERGLRARVEYRERGARGGGGGGGGGGAGGGGGGGAPPPPPPPPLPAPPPPPPRGRRSGDPRG